MAGPSYFLIGRKSDRTPASVVSSRTHGRGDGRCAEAARGKRGEHLRTPIAVIAASCLLACARPGAAQEPAGPPPPSRGGGDAGARYLELLPDVGLIGAQVGALAGPSWNPYDVGLGGQLGGYIDLPLARNRSGRLSYEILLGLSAGKSDAFTVTHP